MIQSKSFYRSLEKVFAGAGRIRHRERFALRIAPALLDVLREPLGVTAVHVYERRKDGFAPAKTWGAKRPDLGADLARRFASTGDDGIRELPWVGDLGTDRIGLVGVGGHDGPLLTLFGPARGDLAKGPSRAEFFAAVNSIL